MIELERAGCPTVVLATDEFHRLANEAARNQGLPGARVAIVAHPIGGVSESVLDARAVGVADEVIKLLTSE